MQFCGCNCSTTGADHFLERKNPCLVAQCHHKTKQTSGYATWFTAGGAIRIALQLWQTWKLRHYDVIDDVITRKL